MLIYYLINIFLYLLPPNHTKISLIYAFNPLLFLCPETLPAFFFIIVQSVCIFFVAKYWNKINKFLVLKKIEKGILVSFVVLIFITTNSYYRDLIKLKRFVYLKQYNEASILVKTLEESNYFRILFPRINYDYYHLLFIDGTITMLSVNDVKDKKEKIMHINTAKTIFENILSNYKHEGQLKNTVRLNLGATYENLSRLNNSKKYLYKSIITLEDAYKYNKEILTKISLVNNLANSYTNYSYFTGKDEYLIKAKDLLNTQIKEIGKYREKTTANLQLNELYADNLDKLANIYDDLAFFTISNNIKATLLVRAISLRNEAMIVLKLENSSDLISSILINRTVTLARLSDLATSLDKKIQYMKEAEKNYNTIIRIKSNDLSVSYKQTAIAIYTKLYDLTKDSNYYEQAQKILEEINSKYNVENFPLIYADSCYRQGNLFFIKGEQENSADLLKRSLMFFDYALEIYDKDNYFKDYLAVQSSKQWALSKLWQITKEKKYNNLAKIIEQELYKIKIRNIVEVSITKNTD